MDVLCPSCGTGNRPAAKFCMQCVAPLDATTANRSFEMTRRVDGFTATVLASDMVTVQGTHDPSRPPPAAFSGDFLPIGTMLEGFRIVRVIGEGGFGIVYLAWDAALERHVAIKEYMPLSLCMRGVSSLDVTTRSERDRETFDAGLRSFVNEARLLARFDHPALVKVLRFWEGHRTAYMAMPYYEGPTLKAALEAMDGPPSEAQLRSWLDPLLDALALIHGEQCYHRDIAPDNILLTPTGPLLLDFGAARRVISDRTQALTTMLKPGFAPIEQYGGAQSQGPWTDLYAVGGVVHYAITGRPPIAAVVRVVEDLQPSLGKAHGRRYSARFLQAIDRALSVRPDARPQDVAQFRAMLAHGAPPAAAAAAPPPKAKAVAKPSPPAPAARTAPLPLEGATPAAPMRGPEPRVARASIYAELPDTEIHVPRKRAASSRWVVVASGLAIGLAGAFGWQLQTSQKAPAAPAATAVSAPAVAPVRAVTAPAVTEAAPARVEAPAPAPPLAATAPTTASMPTPTTPSPIASARVPAKTAPATASVAKPRTDRAAAPNSADTTVATANSVKPVERVTEERADRSGSSYAEKRRPPRCGELVLKASLEPLTPDDVAYLRSTCK